MTVSRMLANEAYAGVMVQGKQRVVSYKVHDRVSVPKEQWIRVQNAQPAIISAEQFEKVQALAEKNTRVTKKSGALTLFAGFLKCADCEKAMRRHGSGQTRQVKYYCRSHCDKGACSPHSISERDLEASVFKAIGIQLKLIDNLCEMTARIREKPILGARSERLNAMMGQKREEMHKMKAIKDEIYLDWKRKIIEKEAYDRIIMKNERQMSQINDAIFKIEAELNECGGDIAAHPVLESLEKYANIHKLDREVLAALIDVVYIHENKEITIVFRYDDTKCN